MNSIFTRISLTALATLALGVTAMFGVASARAATPEGPVIQVLPCFGEFCPPPVPDPDPDPDPKPAIPGMADLTICFQFEEFATPDCDEEVDPETKHEFAGDIMLCTPWMQSLGMCGDGGPAGPDDEAQPEPGCVQIHKEFPCPGDDGDDSDPKEPKVLEPDGECGLILHKKGEPVPVDPDCPVDEVGPDEEDVPGSEADGICYEDPKAELQVADPDCVDPDGVCKPTLYPIDYDGPYDPDCEFPADPGPDTPEIDTPGKDEPGDEPEVPADDPSDGSDEDVDEQPQRLPDDGEEPTRDDEQAIPGAPDAGGGNAVGGMSPTSIYGALALAVAGGILGGAALSLGRKS